MKLKLFGNVALTCVSSAAQGAVASSLEMNGTCWRIVIGLMASA